MTLLKTRKTIIHNVKFNKCGCSQELEFIGSLDNEKETESYYSKVFNGINDYCPKCKAMNAEYGLEKVLQTGDSDSNSTLYIFNHSDIRKVVQFCWLKGLETHTEHHHINSPYDCTGQCFATEVKFKRFKKHITIRYTSSYDV